MSDVRVGVVGVGALGQQHARVFSNILGARLIGVHDRDPARAEDVSSRFGGSAFATLEALFAEVDAVSVAVPTIDHFVVSAAALRAGKDVLVEKPITTTLAEADGLIALARERDCVLQVGHIERFNPATDILRSAGGKPRFIEVHRMAVFTARSLDIDVVLDLMVHDLDIVLALDGSEPVQIEAVGIPVLTPKVDIANARLKFDSGLIANITASRVSAEKIRKFRVFSPRTYVSADFAAREAQVYRLKDGGDGRPEISAERMSAPDQEPLRRQLEAFLQAVRQRSQPVVGGQDGRRALALAQAILARMAEG